MDGIEKKHKKKKLYKKIVTYTNRKRSNQFNVNFMDSMQPNGFVSKISNVSPFTVIDTLTVYVAR